MIPPHQTLEDAACCFGEDHKDYVRIITEIEEGHRALGKYSPTRTKMINMWKACRHPRREFDQGLMAPCCDDCTDIFSLNGYTYPIPITEFEELPK